MTIINLITSEEQLYSERDRIKNVLAEKMSLKPNERLANEMVSWLLGADDWNTATGIVRKKMGNTAQEQTEVIEAKTEADKISDYIHAKLGAKADDEIQCIIEEVDELVFDYLGTAQWVSDEINNQGLEAQINAVVEAGGLDDIWTLLEEVFSLSREACERFNETGELIHHCKKCGTDLDAMGYCQDITCPYDSWPQCVDIEKVYKGDGQGHQRRIGVMAELYNDGHYQSVDFDCSLYFADAAKKGTLEKVVRNVFDRPWLGEHPSDDVALFFKDGGKGDGHDDVRSFLVLEVDAEGSSGKGFQCYVCKDMLADWLKQYEPEVLKATKDIFERKVPGHLRHAMGDSAIN